MTSTTHRGDVFARPRRRRVLTRSRLHSRAALAQVLAPLAALGVLVLLLEGHGLSWLAGLVAGACATAWVTIARRPETVLASAAPAASDHGERETRAQLCRLEGAGWRAVHDIDARFGQYQHIAVGPGGVVLLHSRRLAHPQPVSSSSSAAAADPEAKRELMLLRRDALGAAANLRDEIKSVTGRPSWVQPVIVVWSDFPAGCLADGRCVFVSGARLMDWLRRRPGQLSPARADEVHAALQALASGCDNRSAQPSACSETAARAGATSVSCSRRAASR